MYCLLSVSCVSRLRGVDSCGCWGGVGPRSGAGHHFRGNSPLDFAFSTIFIVKTIEIMRNQNSKNKNICTYRRAIGPSVWIFRQSERKES